MFVLFLDGYWVSWLAFFVWTSFTVAGWLLIRRRNDLRNADRRWPLLSVVLLIGGAQFGVHVDPDRRRPHDCGFIEVPSSPDATAAD